MTATRPLRSIVSRMLANDRTHWSFESLLDGRQVR